MKKSILILALLPLLFFGCKKGSSTDEPEPEEKLYEVKFSTNSFDQFISPIKSSINTTAIPTDRFDPLNYFFNLYYIVVNDENLVIANGSNMIFDADYNFITGSLDFKLKLPKGNYKIGLIGSNDYSGGHLSKHIADVSVNVSTNPVYFSDFKSFTVENDVTVNPLIINRVSSKLKINISDVAPSEPVTVKLFENKQSQLFLFDKRNDVYNYYEKLLGVFNIAGGSENNVLNAFVIPNRNDLTEKFNYEIRIYNTDNVLIGTKKISNVLLKENHITSLTGNLFDVIQPENTGDNFQAKINREYSNIIDGTF